MTVTKVTSNKANQRSKEALATKGTLRGRKVRIVDLGVETGFLGPSRL